MKVMMLAVICSGTEILGFRFMDIEAKNPQPISDTYERTKLCLSKGTIPFGNLALQNGEIKGVGGDISRYTRIDINGNKLGGDSWVILSQLDGGYKVCNYQGVIKTLREQDIVDKLQLANGKIVTRDGKKIVSSISGEYEKSAPATKAQPKTPKPIDKAAAKGIASPDSPPVQGNPEPLVEEMNTPYLSESQRLYNMGITRTAYDTVKLEDIKDEHSQYDCGTKLRRALFTLRDWSPLYFAIITKLDRIVTTQVKTMGVSLSEFVINPYFVAKLTEPELMFILYHEVFHIILGHTFRCGPNRDHEVWNIAADLIVNQYILNDMSANGNTLKPGGTITVTGGKSTLITQITAEANGCYGDVDLSKDTAESIYEELIANQSVQTMPLTQASAGGSGQGGSSGMAGSSGSGSQQSSSMQSGSGGQQMSGGQQSAQSGMGNGQSGNQQGTAGMQAAGGGQSSGQSGGQQGQSSGSAGQNGSQGQGGAKSGAGQEDENVIGQVIKTTFNFRGKKITSELSLDLDDSAVKSNASANAQGIAEAELKRMLTSATVASKKTRGTIGTGALGERIKMMLAPQVNWRLLLERFVSMSTETMYTYARPDRRFLWKNEVLPGPKKEKNKLKDLIIAIDTSGSISTEQLALAAGHIWNIYKKYNVNAYVVYWDTAVQRVEELKRRGDIVNMMPPRGGGTALNSFLEWFKKRTMGGHKALDPCAVLVITDGYIESNQEINEASKGLIKVRYSDKFIWLITDDDNYMKWKPPYGKKVRYLK